MDSNNKLINELLLKEEIVKNEINKYQDQLNQIQNEINKLQLNNNNSNKKLKTNNNQQQQRIVKLSSNLLVVKILKYAIRKSLKKNEQYDLICKLSLICKDWNLFIIPKLNVEQYIIKGDDYLYSYLKVRDSIRELMNRRNKTGYQLSNDSTIRTLLGLLYCPNVETGTYNVDYDEATCVGYKYNIYIDNQECGTIFKPDIAKIKQLSSPSSFGQGTNLVYDESIRKGTHIDGNKVHVPFFDRKNRLENGDLVPKVYKYFIDPDVPEHYLERNTKFQLELYKIHIYEQGGKFEEHTDTIQSMNHVGTYIVPLGVETYTGGEFVVSESDSFDHTTTSYKIEATVNKSSEENSIDFKWIGFYNDCIHKVEPVTGGTRIVLQFNILANQNVKNDSIRIGGEYPDSMSEGEHYTESINYSNKYQYLAFNSGKIGSSKKVKNHMEYNKRIFQKVSKSLIEICGNVTRNNNSTTVVKRCGIFLNHLYKAHVNENHLKGVDILLWNELKSNFPNIKISSFLVTSHTDYSKEEDEMDELKIALLSPKTLNQSIVQEDDIKDTQAHTLLFLNSGYGSINTIYSKPLASTGNYERYYEDIGCFSAIIISFE